jgi:hypothetical protein
MLVDLSDRLHYDAPGDVLNLQGVRFIGNRYRYKGKIISKPDAMQRLEVFIDSQTEAMQAIAAKPDLSIADIEIEGAKILKRIAIAQTVLGAGGFEGLTNADLGTAGAWLKTQYYSGKGEDGKPFGLRHLARDWAAGDASQAQLAARLKMYGKAPKQLYWKVWSSRQDGGLFIRKLGKTDNHCKTCIAQSRIKGRPIEQVKIPGCCPECYSSCKCSIVPA